VVMAAQSIYFIAGIVQRRRIVGSPNEGSDVEMLSQIQTIIPLLFFSLHPPIFTPIPFSSLLSSSTTTAHPIVITALPLTFPPIIASYASGALSNGHVCT